MHFGHRPFPGFPCPSRATTLRLIAAHRDELPFNDQLPTLDPPVHTDHRALLSRMITPKRLKENEEFMWRLADRQYDERCAGTAASSSPTSPVPFAMLVIADLLGVPESDHAEFRRPCCTGPARSAAARATRCTLAAGVPLRQVHRVHHRPPRPARRRADRRRLGHLPDEQWDRVMAVNLRGPFICTQAVLPDMLDAEWGRIVNISSSSAQGGNRGWPPMWARRPG